MTHGGRLHGVPGSLARHIGQPHAQPGDRRRVAFEVTPMAERRHWSREELLATHRELHEGIPAVRAAAWPTAPGIPVPDAFEGLAASRTAAPGTDGGSGSAAPAGQVTPGSAGAPQRRTPPP